jgi:hypothetical protein
MKHSDNSSQHTSADFPFSEEETGALGAFRQGLEHEVEGLVKLELTAEQMLGDEVNLAKAYIHDDAGHVWSDIKEGWHFWESATGEWLLTAADPTRVDWQLHRWWGDDEVHLH